jgi:hypothetical protein
LRTVTYEHYLAGECVPYHRHVWHVLHLPLHGSDLAETANGCCRPTQTINKYVLFFLIYSSRDENGILLSDRHINSVNLTANYTAEAQEMTGEDEPLNP